MSDLLISYSSEEKQGWFLWQVKGRLDRITAAGATEEGRRLLQGQVKFALDLSELAYLSSAGIRAILTLADGAQKQGISFALDDDCEASVKMEYDLKNRYVSFVPDTSTVCITI